MSRYADARDVDDGLTAEQRWRLCDELLGTTQQAESDTVAMEAAQRARQKSDFVNRFRRVNIDRGVVARAVKTAKRKRS